MSDIMMVDFNERRDCLAEEEETVSGRNLTDDFRVRYMYGLGCAQVL
jgi:hypothetical protein